MAKRNCPTLQKSLDWCEGMPSHPGVRRRVYFCNKNLIVAYPTLPRDEFGRPTAAILEGNFELADGAYWQYLDINIDKSTVTSEPQGEVPSQTQLNKATFVHNGIDEEATAAAGWLNNSDNVYIVEDMPGKFRVLGNNKWRTLTTVNQDMGQGTNPASTTINVEVTDEVAAPFYFGSIETEDGTVTPDAVVTPYVSTKSLNMSVGQTAQIVFGPKDGNWTFSSSSTRTATVNGSGLVTAVAQGSSNITCMYNGETVHTIAVGVGFVAGDDNGEGEEVPAADEPKLKLTVPQGGEINTGYKVGSSAPGWKMISEDETIISIGMETVDNTPYHTLCAEDLDGGACNVCAIQGNKMDWIYATCPPTAITLAPGASREIEIFPFNGWTISNEDDSLATASWNTASGKLKIVAVEGDGTTNVTLTNNESNDQIVIGVTVDESIAG